MRAFEYYNPTRIYFGEEVEASLHSFLQGRSIQTLLLVTTAHSAEALGILDLVQRVCDAENIRLLINREVVPNPEMDLVRKLATCCKEESVDYLLAVGGGSSIDTAKAVAVAACYEGDPWDFFQGRPIERALPLVCIPTIPGSGSESSNAAILSQGAYKRGIESEWLYPQAAFLNPAYTKTLSPFQTAVGIMDSLSHLLERYFTQDCAEVTDRQLEAVMQTLWEQAPRVLEHPTDLEARAEVMWCANIAHNGSLDAGRTACWGCHRVEHELSGEYGLTHGEGMGMVFIAWLRYMAKVCPGKPAQLADRLFHLDPWVYEPAEATQQLANRLEHFAREMGLRTRLSEFGIGEDRFEIMAARATEKGPVGHYVPLTADRIVEILRLAR